MNIPILSGLIYGLPGGFYPCPFFLFALHFLAFSHLSSPLSLRQSNREPSVFIS